MNGSNVLIGLILLFGFVLYPLGAIWAINTLFGVAIAYSFKTWAAAVLLLLITQASRS